jgi:hypothetical protein
MRDDLIERLFSLFTSSDCAEAIAGDLIQERPDQGSRWFWCHAFATAASLWRAAVAEAPVLTLLVAASGCALMAGPVFAGVAAVRLFPTLLSDMAAWSLLAILWWGGALSAGASMVAIAPRRGMSACVTLAILCEVVLLAVWFATGTFHMIAAGAAWPLLTGAAFARTRVIGLTDSTLEHQS